MISAGDFKNGITLEIDGNVMQILEFQHVKPGKGAAFVRTKLKYSDGDLFHFMNMESYEQIALNDEVIGDALKFVKENETVKVCSYNGNVFTVEPPLFVELEVTDTEPGFKGDTAQGAIS